MNNINPNDGKRSNVQPGHFGKSGKPQGNDSKPSSLAENAKQETEKSAPANDDTSEVSRR